MSKKSYYRQNKKYFVLKVLGGRYDGLYVEHTDESGYSHIDDINYARPYTQFAVGNGIVRYYRMMGNDGALLPIMINKLDNKFIRERSLKDDEVNELCEYADEIVKELEE